MKLLILSIVNRYSLILLQLLGLKINGVSEYANILMIGSLVSTFLISGVVGEVFRRKININEFFHPYILFFPLIFTVLYIKTLSFSNVIAIILAAFSMSLVQLIDTRNLIEKKINITFYVFIILSSLIWGAFIFVFSIKPTIILIIKSIIETIVCVKLISGNFNENSNYSLLDNVKKYIINLLSNSRDVYISLLFIYVSISLLSYKINPNLELLFISVISAINTFLMKANFYYKYRSDLYLAISAAIIIFTGFLYVFIFNNISIDFVVCMVILSISGHIYMVPYIEGRLSISASKLSVYILILLVIVLLFSNAHLLISVLAIVTIIDLIVNLIRMTSNCN